MWHYGMNHEKDLIRKPTKRVIRNLKCRIVHETNKGDSMRLIKV